MFQSGVVEIQGFSAILKDPCCHSSAMLLNMRGLENANQNYVLSCVSCVFSPSVALLTLFIELVKIRNSFYFSGFCAKKNCLSEGVIMTLTVL